ncbi:MAG: hypothetical protein R3211_01310 [Balneolaceae bacterium]|nr:hypothetical protein [Balneolaceae bacterium]
MRIIDSDKPENSFGSDMIIIDRHLNEEEKKSLDSSHPVVDLTGQAEDPGDNSFQKEIFNWIDQIAEHTFNGETPFEYFTLLGSSYWLHVRGRLFRALYSDGRQLDKLPDLSILGKARIIYCYENQKPFWKRWAPQANLVSSSTDQHESADGDIDVGTLIRRIWFTLNHLSDINQTTVGQGWECICFSPMTNTVLRNGRLVDKQLDSLLMKKRRHWLRLEYQHLPIYRPADTEPGFFKHDRNHPTLMSDPLLAAYLIHHPKTVNQMIKGYRSLRKFREPLTHSYSFSFQNDRWQSYLHRLIQRYTPSFLIFHLFSRAFHWLLEQSKPHYVFATSENNSIGRIFIDEAQNLDIPTFGVQHGTIAPYNIDYRFSKTEAEKALPDYFFVWGEAIKDYLVEEQQYDPSRTFVVGQLEYDRVLDRLAPNRTLSEFKERRNRPVLFFASQNQPDTRSHLETARALARFCRDYELACCVKLHPGEHDATPYLDQFSQFQCKDDLILLDDSIYALIAASDFGATCYSTVAWEIMGMKKPLIIIDPLELNLLNLKNRESVYYIGYQQPEFQQWKKNIKSHIDENYDYAVRRLGPRDGRTARRIQSTITDIMEG